MEQQFKQPRKRCRAGGIQDMVYEVSTRLDAFLDAIESLLAQLDTQDAPTEDLEGLELDDEDSKT